MDTDCRQDLRVARAWPMSQAVAAARAARISGFELLPAKSPRNLAIAWTLARTLALAVPARPGQSGADRRCGRRPTLDAIVEPPMPLDMLQLHGARKPRRAWPKCKARYGLPVMKVRGRAPMRADLAATLGPLSDRVADQIMIDAKAPKGRRVLPGGNGVPFDWTLLVAQRRLAAGPGCWPGGLTPEQCGRGDPI